MNPSSGRMQAANRASASVSFDSVRERVVSGWILAGLRHPWIGLVRWVGRRALADRMALVGRFAGVAVQLVGHVGRAEVRTLCPKVLTELTVPPCRSLTASCADEHASHGPGEGRRTLEQPIFTRTRWPVSLDRSSVQRRA